MVYREHFDTWQSEQAALARQTCNSCGALNCTGICVIGDLMADFEYYSEKVRQVQDFIDDVGLTPDEAMSTVFKGDGEPHLTYTELCRYTDEIAESIDRTLKAEEAKR